MDWRRPFAYATWTAAWAFERRLQDIDLAGNGTRQLATLPALDGLSRVYSIELELAQLDGKIDQPQTSIGSRRKPTSLDWAHSTWYLTPVTRYAT